MVEAPRSACGKLTCSGATPVCCYDAKTKTARCIASTPDKNPYDDPACPIGEQTARLACASPADCGGEACCTSGPAKVTSCGGQCMSGIDTCRTVADCPAFLGSPTGCTPDPAIPILKTCEYGGK